MLPLARNVLRSSFLLYFWLFLSCWHTATQRERGKQNEDQHVVKVARQLKPLHAALVVRAGSTTAERLFAVREFETASKLMNTLPAH